jgi:hypothetical protein
MTLTVDRIAQEVRHGALAAALVVALVAPSGVDAQGGGTINGLVTTTAQAAKPIRVTMDQSVCGNELPDEAMVVDSAGRLANVVVTLVGVKACAGATSGGVMNEKCRFAPRVQITRPNAAITTSSKDPILHTTNAAMDGGKALFNAIPVPGLKITKSLMGPGLVRVVCNTHPWMRSYIVVTDDMTAVTAADGTFTLSDVPAGTYELRVWHETLKAPAQKVVVRAAQATSLDIKMQ